MQIVLMSRHKRWIKIVIAAILWSVSCFYGGYYVKGRSVAKIVDSLNRQHRNAMQDLVVNITEQLQEYK